ncbi:MAG: GNAT superfamily N-acetyltransferase [Saprospiraceae bacterium]|jgi:GNAT superfamily N-acetyltransferase
MKFRLANKSDISNIAKLHADSWQMNYRGSFSDEYLENEVHGDRLEVWTERLNNPTDTQHVLLAEEHEMLMGFVCTFLDYHKEWGAYLDNLHVQPTAYGQGLGGQLLVKSAAYVAKYRSNSELYLWVLEKNLGAIRFYGRMGGLNKGSTEFQNPGGGKSNALRIVWDNPSIVRNTTGRPL